MPITKASGNSVTAAAKGDLVVGNATNDSGILSVGADATVLTADSTTSTGLKWAAAATPVTGSNWSLLSSATLSGSSTITISGISGKDKIMVLFASASSATASAEMNIRLNGSTSGYYNFGQYYQWQSTYAAGNFENVSGGSYSAIYGGRMSNNATSSVGGAVTITGCNSSGVKQFIAVNNGNAAGGTGQYGFSVQGYWDNSATVSSISLVSSVGNFDNGTLYVYTSAS